MWLRTLEGLGLVKPSTQTGTFMTMPYAVQKTISSTVVGHFASDVLRMAESSLRSAADMRTTLEATGLAFSFPLPECETLIVQALTVYEWMLDPAHATLLPEESAALGSPARDELIVTLVRHISQAFESRTDRAEASFRAVVIAAANTLASIMRMNEPHLPPSSPAWRAIIDVASAIVTANEKAGCVPTTRAATASVLIEALLLSRNNTKEAWLLAGEAVGRSQASLSMLVVWRAAATAISRALSAALSGSGAAVPASYRVDWPWMPVGMREATTVPGHTVAELVLALTSLLRLFGPPQDLSRIESLHEASATIADVAFLFAGSVLWPCDVDADLRFELTERCDNPIRAPFLVGAGPSTAALASLVVNTLLLMLKALPASPPNGVPSTESAVLAQRARITAFNGACAAFVRRESVGLAIADFTPFLSAAIDALEDASAVVQGQALVALLPLYGILRPADFPEKLATALLVSSTNMLSPHLAESSDDCISIVRPGARPPAPTIAPSNDSTANTAHLSAALAQLPRGAASSAGGSTLEQNDTVALAQTARTGTLSEFEVVDTEVHETMLLCFRQAACSHLANAGAACPSADHAGMVLGVLLRATQDFGVDVNVLPPLLSCATHVLAHMGESILGEEPNASEGRTTAGPRFELATSIIDQVTRLLASNSEALQTIPCLLLLLRDLPVPSVTVAHSVLEAMADFACNLRSGLDVAGITNSIVAKRSDDQTTSQASVRAVASRLFALTARSMSRLCGRMHRRCLAVHGKGFFDMGVDVFKPLLQVVDAGFKTVAPEAHPMRDAAEVLLNDTFLWRRWPLAPAIAAVQSHALERTYMAQARTIKAFASQSSRIVTVMQVADADPDEPDFLIVVVRDTSGRWCWRFEVDEVARQEPMPAADQVASALEALNESIPTTHENDILARTSLDAARHDAVIRRWKGDPALAEALRNMENAESVTAKAAAADTRDFVQHRDGYQALAQSGRFTALTRRFLADTGFISPRTTILNVDAKLLGMLKALDVAAPSDVFDVLVQRYSLQHSPSLREEFEREEDDVLRFRWFCAALGQDVTNACTGGAASSSSDKCRVFADETPYASLRYHCRDWIEDDEHNHGDDRGNAAAAEPPIVRITWDATPERYDFTALPTVGTRAYQQLNPQWAPRQRDSIEIVVAQLQETSTAENADGLFLVRLLLPRYFRSIAGAFALAPPLLPNTQTIVPASVLPSLLRSACIGVLEDSASAAPGPVTPCFVRRRLIERIVLETGDSASPDPLGTGVLAHLLAS